MCKNTKFLKLKRWNVKLNSILSLASRSFTKAIHSVCRLTLNALFNATLMLMWIPIHRFPQKQEKDIENYEFESMLTCLFLL
jgi:hypothetical protein